MTPTPTPPPLDPVSYSVLLQIAELDAELGERAKTLAWVQDALAGKGRGWVPLAFFRDLAGADLETASMLLDYPWMADELDPLEYNSIISLTLIAEHDKELARRMMAQPFMQPPFRDRDSFALESLSLLVVQPQTISLLEEQQWFSDGLDDYETALLAVIRSEAYIGGRYREALIESHRIISKPVEFPLAGDAELILISHEQELDYDEIFTAMEVGVRSHEEFLDLPFPFNDVIFLVNDPALWPTPSGGYKLGSDRSGYFTLDFPMLLRHIYHELGHFYMSGAGNRWMVEGGTDFLKTVAMISVGETAIDQTMDYLDGAISEVCDDTIAESLIDWHRSNCDYYLGERLLWHMYLDLGEGTVKAVLRNMVLRYREGSPVTEEEIYDIFRKHTPPDKLPDLRKLYRTFHGGPVAD